MLPQLLEESQNIFEILFSNFFSKKISQLVVFLCLWLDGFWSLWADLTRIAFYKARGEVYHKYAMDTVCRVGNHSLLEKVIAMATVWCSLLLVDQTEANARDQFIATIRIRKADEQLEKLFGGTLPDQVRKQIFGYQKGDKKFGGGGGSSDRSLNNISPHTKQQRRAQQQRRTSRASRRNSRSSVFLHSVEGGRRETMASNGSGGMSDATSGVPALAGTTSAESRVTTSNFNNFRAETTNTSSLNYAEQQQHMRRRSSADHSSSSRGGVISPTTSSRRRNTAVLADENENLPEAEDGVVNLTMYDRSLGGLLAHKYDKAALLQADLVNFTALAATKTPRDMLRIVNELFYLFDSVMLPNVIRLETVGDAYICASTTSPLARKFDPTATLQVGLRMVKELDNWRARPFLEGMDDNSGLESIDCRVGCHVGSCIGGIVGKDMKRYHLFGQAMQVMDLAEATSQPGKVHCTRAFYESILEATTNTESELQVIPPKGGGVSSSSSSGTTTGSGGVASPNYLPPSFGCGSNLSSSRSRWTVVEQSGGGSCLGSSNSTLGPASSPSQDLPLPAKRSNNYHEIKLTPEKNNSNPFLSGEKSSREEKWPNTKLVNEAFLFRKRTESLKTSKGDVVPRRRLGGGFSYFVYDWPALVASYLVSKKSRYSMSQKLREQVDALVEESGRRGEISIRSSGLITSNIPHREDEVAISLGAEVINSREQMKGTTTTSNEKSSALPKREKVLGTAGSVNKDSVVIRGSLEGHSRLRGFSADGEC